MSMTFMIAFAVIPSPIVITLPGSRITTITSTYSTPLSPPRWRLACKAIVDPNLQADAADLVVKVTPRGFDGFYGVEECNLDGEPLQRPGQK